MTDSVPSRAIACTAGRVIAAAPEGAGGRVVGDTGLEPVTPSLSIASGGGCRTYLTC